MCLYSLDTLDLEIEDTQIAGTITPVSRSRTALKHSWYSRSSNQHELRPKHNVMGSALYILLPTRLNSGETVVIVVRYRTSPESTALQWLDKEWLYVHVQCTYIINFRLCRQTQGKQHPFVFSQCQPIYARSLAPLQGRYMSTSANQHANIFLTRYSIC